MAFFKNLQLSCNYNVLGTVFQERGLQLFEGLLIKNKLYE